MKLFVNKTLLKVVLGVICLFGLIYLLNGFIQEIKGQMHKSEEQKYKLGYDDFQKGYPPIVPSHLDHEIQSYRKGYFQAFDESKNKGK